MCGLKQVMVLQISFESDYFLHLKKTHICQVVFKVWKATLDMSWILLSFRFQACIQDLNVDPSDTGFVWNMDILLEILLHL